MIYDELTRAHSADAAQRYARAQQDALRWMGDTVRDLGLECDWRTRTAATYTTEEDKVGELEDELLAATDAGLPVRAATVLDVPFAVRRAVILRDQAEFHPRRYLLGLAEQFVRDGGRVYESTRATGVAEHGTAPIVRTTGGDIQARHVVVATHAPFLDRSLFFARLSAQRSYAIAVRLEDGADVPQTMAYGHDSVMRSLRSHPDPDGPGDLLLVGGEGHKTGQDGHTDERYAALESWAREHFPVVEVPYRWSAQDLMPVDGMPYVGAYRPRSKAL